MITERIHRLRSVYLGSAGTKGGQEARKGVWGLLWDGR